MFAQRSERDEVLHLAHELHVDAVPKWLFFRAFRIVVLALRIPCRRVRITRADDFHDAGDARKRQCPLRQGSRLDGRRRICRRFGSGLPAPSTLTGVPLANVTALAPLYASVDGNGSRMKTVLLSTAKLPELEMLME